MQVLVQVKVVHQPYLFKNSLYSICRRSPDLIIILWKDGRSIAHSLHGINAENTKLKDVVSGMLFYISNENVSALNETVSVVLTYQIQHKVQVRCICHTF